jgi:hypothetical protein
VPVRMTLPVPGAPVRYPTVTVVCAPGARFTKPGLGGDTLATAPVRELVMVTPFKATAQLFLTMNLATEVVSLTLVTGTRFGIVTRGGLHISVNCGLMPGDVGSVPEQASAMGSSRQSFERVRIADSSSPARENSLGRGPKLGQGWNVAEKNQFPVEVVACGRVRRSRLAINLESDRALLRHSRAHLRQAASTNAHQVQTGVFARHGSQGNTKAAQRGRPSISCAMLRQSTVNTLLLG